MEGSAASAGHKQRRKSHVRDDREDFSASLGGNQRLFDLAHVHLHRNHFELVFVFVVVELVCSIQSIHSTKKRTLCRERVIRDVSRDEAKGCGLIG